MIWIPVIIAALLLLLVLIVALAAGNRPAPPRTRPNTADLQHDPRQTTGHHPTPRRHA